MTAICPATGWFALYVGVLEYRIPVAVWAVDPYGGDDVVGMIPPGGHVDFPGPLVRVDNVIDFDGDTVEFIGYEGPDDGIAPEDKTSFGSLDMGAPAKEQPR